MSNWDDLSYGLVDGKDQVVTFIISKGSVTWMCTTTYAFRNPSIHFLLWDYFVSLSNIIQSPWLIVGDMNEILLPSRCWEAPL